MGLFNKDSQSHGISSTPRFDQQGANQTLFGADNNMVGNSYMNVFQIEEDNGSIKT